MRSNVDDILVGGKGREEHDTNLLKGLERTTQVKLRLNPKKLQVQV